MSRLLFYLLAVVVAGCTGPSIGEEELVQAEPPLESISFQGSEITVRLLPEADWRSLVDLSSFRGFEPGMTHDMARSLVGPPDETRGAMYVYDRPTGRVVVARVVERSEGARFEAWQLRATPARDELSEVFAPTILKHLRGRTEGEQHLVILHPQEYGPALSARIRNGRVKAMTWFRG